jgi:hypothetical protein
MLHVYHDGLSVKGTEFHKPAISGKVDSNPTHETDILRARFLLFCVVGDLVMADPQSKDSRQICSRSLDPKVHSELERATGYKSVKD